MLVRHMPFYGPIGIKDPRSKINPHNDKSETQEDRLSLNAVEHVARAANDSIQNVSHEAKLDSIAILTSVDVLSRAGLEESHENLRTRTINEERQKRSEKSSARRFAGRSDDYTPTPDSVAQAKALVPGEVHWTGPPRESPLSAMYNDTLDPPSREVEASLPARLHHDRILLVGMETRGKGRIASQEVCNVKRSCSRPCL